MSGAGSAKELAGTSPAAPPSLEDGSHSSLFGRGLLYVVVWSLQLLASTIVSPILAHLLGPRQFGSLASAIALYQVLSVAALLGLDQALVLQRADDNDARTSRGLVAVAVVVSFGVTALALITSPFWGPAFGFAAEPGLVRLVILWTAPSAAVQVMLSLLIAEDRLKVFSIVSVISAVGGSFVGLLLLVVVPGANAVTYAWGGVVCQFLAMLVGFFVTRPSLSGLVNWNVSRRAITLGVPLALGALASFVLNAGDRIVIQRELGATEVGRYQIAYVIGSAVILLLTFTSSAWTPVFARLRDDRARYALAMKSRDDLYRLLMPVTLAVTLIAPLALRILAPASFRPFSLSFIVFVIALTAFPVAAGGASGRLLVINRQGKTLGVLSGVAAIVNIGLNLVLVPVMGIAGSALATLLSFTLLAVIQRRTLPRASTRRRSTWSVDAKHGRHWQGPSLRLTMAVLVTVTLAGISILLPQTLEWNIGRAVFAAACLPWFVRRLRDIRGQGATSQ